VGDQCLRGSCRRLFLLRPCGRNRNMHGSPAADVLAAFHGALSEHRPVVVGVPNLSAWQARGWGQSTSPCQQKKRKGERLPLEVEGA
jgi:hypothetical protein